MNRKLIVLISLFSVTVAALAQNAQLDQKAAPKNAPHSAISISSPTETVQRAVLPDQENWAVLPLAKSGLNPLAFNAVLLSKIDQPTYTRELVRVEWRMGDPIEMYVVRPRGVKKPPVILYLYDYISDTDRFLNPSWCKQATQGGFAAVGFVSALSGQRFHAPRPMKEWFVSDMQEALGTSTHDVQMMVNYLEQRADLDAKTVGMFGEGSGGAIAVLAASVDPRIVALDLLNPWGDWPEWLKYSRQIPENERALYLKPEFLQSISTLDPVMYLPQVKIKSLRVQQIMDDLVTPLAARDKIAAAAPDSKDVVRYPDTTALIEVFRKSGLNGWLRVQLSPSPQKPNSPTMVANEIP